MQMCTENMEMEKYLFFVDFILFTRRSGVVIVDNVVSCITVTFHTLPLFDFSLFSIPVDSHSVLNGYNNRNIKIK